MAMRIYVRVVPRASQNRVEKIGECEYKIRLTKSPVKGEANELLIALLAKHFCVAKSLVVIAGGKSARTKIIDIMV